MATKSEEARANEQRTGAAGAGKKRASKPRAKRRAAGHVETKATYAREPRSASGRASRKSTRSSANRIKTDAPMNVREELRMSAPSSRARHDRAKSKQARSR